MPRFRRKGRLQPRLANPAGARLPLGQALPPLPCSFPGTISVIMGEDSGGVSTTFATVPVLPVYRPLSFTSCASLPGGDRKGCLPLMSHPEEESNVSDFAYSYNGETDSLLTMDLTCPKQAIPFSTLNLPLFHPMVLPLLGS